MENIFKAAKIVSNIVEKRNKSRKKAVENEANLYEKVNLLINHSAKTCDNSLIDEVIFEIKSASIQAIEKLTQLKERS
jgi:hypothetical protein